MEKFHCVMSRYMYQSRHNQKYHWASNNEKQVPFWNILLEQTQLLNLCKKQYSYSTILNIKINFFSPSTMMIIHSWAIMRLLVGHHAVTLYFRYSLICLSLLIEMCCVWCFYLSVFDLYFDGIFANGVISLFQN
jgi:hypothetical protein